MPPSLPSPYDDFPGSRPTRAAASLRGLAGERQANGAHKGELHGAAVAEAGGAEVNQFLGKQGELFYQ